MDDDDVAVWRIVDLDAVAKDGKLWKPDSTKLFNKVNWSLVNQKFREALLGGDTDDQQRVAVSKAETTLKRKKDRLGLGALWMEPIVLFPNQVTNGMHRSEAMRRQGVRWTIGYYLESDEGGAWMRAIDEEPF